jgi:hypothetical protein
MLAMGAPESGLMRRWVNVGGNGVEGDGFGG